MREAKSSNAIVTENINNVMHYLIANRIQSLDQASLTIGSVPLYSACKHVYN